MTSSLDDHLSVWLAAYQVEALATESGGNTVPQGELVPRLLRAVRCLRLLDQVLPASATEPGALPPLLAPGPTDPLGLSPPQRLGRFAIVRPLGYGGCGIVYLAEDPLLGRAVALKVPRLPALVSPELRRRVLHEARLAAGLRPPNLAVIHEAGAIGPLCYLASEYCPGPSLAVWLKQQTQPVCPRQAAQFVATLAEAVQFIHAQGILHRDLKPANVLLQHSTTKEPKEPQGESFDRNLSPGRSPRVSSGSLVEAWIPKITDFGLAKDLTADQTETRSGAILGTPVYMAPEQAEGRLKDVGPATDVYALGAILYELLTGQPPYRGQSDADTLRQIRAHDPIAPRRLRPSLPRDLQSICLRCLEREPGRRYGSAAALAEDLHRFLAGEPVLARPAGMASRLGKWYRRRPLVAGLLTALVFSVVVGFAAVVWQWQRAEHQYRRAEANLQQAHQAVHDHFDRINDNRLFDDPQFQPARGELLKVSLRYYRNFLQQRSQDPALEPRLAEASYRAAFITAAIGDQQEALRIYRGSLPLWEKLARNHPEVAEYAYFLAKTHDNMGGLHARFGELEEAERCRVMARNLLEKQAGNRPNGVSVPIALTHCYVHLGGVLQRKGQLTAALDSFQRAQSLVQTLLDRQPDSEEFRRLLAGAHLRIGSTLKLRGENKAAEASFQRGTDLLGPLVAQGKSPLATKDLAGAHHLLA